MTTPAIDDFSAIRARQAEIEAERHRNTDASADGHMPEDDWATLRAQSRAAAITRDLGPSMAVLGVRHETLGSRLAEMGVRVDGDRPRVVPSRILP